MKTKIETLLAYIAARAAERSTWEGIGFLLTLAGSHYGASLPLDQCVALGAGLSGAIKILFPDQPQPAKAEKEKIMTYPIQAGAPTISHGGNTYGIAAQENDNPVENLFQIGVMVEATGTWNLVGPAFVISIPTDASLQNAIAAAGSVEAYMQTVIIPGVNAILATITPAAPVAAPAAPALPTSYAQASAAVVAAVNALKLTVNANGVIVAG